MIILLTSIRLHISRASTHVFDRANRTTGRGICENLTFWILHDSWLFPLVHFTCEKRTNRWTSRELLIVQESPIDVSISNFWDLYCNSCIWLEQSTKVWAIVCKTTILFTLVPFEWGMSLKHNEWIGRVLFELGSNRSRAQVKNLKKLNRRHGKDEFWKNISCLFGRV